MDRDREAGIITASGAALAVVGIAAFIAWRKRKGHGSSTPSYSTGAPSNYPPLNNNYEWSDDGLAVTSYTTGNTTGWINHNPGNIVKTSDQWLGKVGDDGHFVKFVSNLYGYRAMIKTLQTYIRKGYNTARKIVDRWSGVSNNTNYLNFVVANSILDADEVIAANDYISLMSLVSAIAMMENGKSPEPDDNEIADAAILVSNGI